MRFANLVTLIPGLQPPPIARQHSRTNGWPSCDPAFDVVVKSSCGLYCLCTPRRRLYSPAPERQEDEGARTATQALRSWTTLFICAESICEERSDKLEDSNSFLNIGALTTPHLTRVHVGLKPLVPPSQLRDEP